MYKVYRVNREGYESNKEMYDQNSRKLEKAFNDPELVKLTKECHLKETMHDLKFGTIPELTSKDREFKNCVSQICFGRKDSQNHQERIRRDLGHVENKIDHLTTRSEAEAWRGLRERK